MNVDPSHKECLGFSIDMQGMKSICTAQEFTILLDYGYWMGSICVGLIQPTTEGHQRFINVYRKICEEKTIHEIAWSKYVVNIIDQEQIRLSRMSDLRFCQCEDREEKNVVIRAYESGWHRCGSDFCQLCGLAVPEIETEIDFANGKINIDHLIHKTLRNSTKKPWFSLPHHSDPLV